MPQTLRLTIDEKLQNKLDYAQSYFPGLKPSQIIRVVFFRYFESDTSQKNTWRKDKSGYNWKSIKQNLSQISYSSRPSESIEESSDYFDFILRDKQKSNVTQKEYEDSYESWWNKNKKTLRG
jgi:hypothetical protein